MSSTDFAVVFRKLMNGIENCSDEQLSILECAMKSYSSAGGEEPAIDWSPEGTLNQLRWAVKRCESEIEKLAKAIEYRRFKEKAIVDLCGDSTHEDLRSHQRKYGSSGGRIA